jgi:hypothetical protein
MAERRMHVWGNTVKPQSSDNISFWEKLQRKLKGRIESSSIT